MLVGATYVFSQHKLVRCREETLLAPVCDLLGMKKNMNGKAPTISRGLLADVTDEIVLFCMFRKLELKLCLK